MAELPPRLLPYQTAVSTLGKPQKSGTFLARSGTWRTWLHEHVYQGNVANKALELLGRHQGMFTDQLKLSGGLGMSHYDGHCSLNTNPCRRVSPSPRWVPTSPLCTHTPTALLSGVKAPTSCRTPGSLPTKPSPSGECRVLTWGSS